MGEFSVFHWLVVLAIILIFFGGRRIPEVMKGLGEGIRSFKDGIAGGTATATAPAPAQPTTLVGARWSYGQARPWPGFASTGIPAPAPATIT